MIEIRMNSGERRIVTDDEAIRILNAREGVAIRATAEDRRETAMLKVQDGKTSRHHPGTDE